MRCFFFFLSDSSVLQGHLLLIIRDKLLQFPGKRMEAVISPEFTARGDDKEEIWAGVKVSNKCSTASPNVVEMEMSAVFVVRWRPEMLAVCQTRRPHNIRSALAPDCFFRYATCAVPNGANGRALCSTLALLKRRSGLCRLGPLSQDSLALATERASLIKIP